MTNQAGVLDEKALAAAIATWPKAWEEYRLGEAIAKAVTAYLAAVPSTAVRETVVHLGPWCQPMDCGKHKPRHFIVRFEDPDRGEAIFTDEDEAYEFWENASLNWNCWLFGAMPCRTPASLASGAKPVAGEPCRLTLDEQKTFREAWRDSTTPSAIPVADVAAGLEPVAWRWRLTKEAAGLHRDSLMCPPWHYTEDGFLGDGCIGRDVEPLYSASQLSALEGERDKYRRKFNHYHNIIHEPGSVYTTVAEKEALEGELRKAKDEIERWQSNWDANVQEMSEKFRAVNIAKVIEATGADIFALRDRAETSERELASLRARLDKALEQRNQYRDEASRLRYPDTTGQ